MLTLSFYIAFAPAVAYADATTDKIDKLQIDLQKRVGDRWTLSPRNKSVGAGVEIGVSQSYPVTATTTATTAAGATTTNTATLTAERIGSKIFTPTTANIAKRFAGGVATTMVAMALYDLLKKSVDYVMDPANNRVIYKELDDSKLVVNISGVEYYSAQDVCDVFFGSGTVGVVEGSYVVCYKDGNKLLEYPAYSSSDVPVSFDTLAQRSIDIANNPNHKDVATAQAGMQTVVGDMITKNEINNSYFNDASISNDTYNDVTNNYINNITNQYPSVSVPSQGQMSQAAASGKSSVTNTTQNSDGSTTTTTTNFNTTNNTTNNNTTNNNTYNITNITVNNPAAQKDDSPASAPASTTTPASTPTTTPNPQIKPFELPAFCDWAKPVCDFIDWFKKDDTSDTDVDVNVPQTPSIDTDINFGGSCPANVTGSFVIGGRTTTFNIMDWSQFCLIMSTYLKPLVIALASYQAVKILAGRNESN